MITSILHDICHSSSSSRCWRRPALMFSLLLLLLAAGPAGAAVVSSSKIQYCTNTGSEPPNCAKKMIISLTVEAGQLPGVEEIATVAAATDDTAGGETVNFVPLTLTASRSVVRYRYPVFYVQNYNAKPYEGNVGGTVLRQCNADYDASRATCGIALDRAGQQIPYSQGFCCGCSLCQTAGLCKPGARATAACDLFGTYSMASCLRFGPRWYSGYTIGSAASWYTINVTVSGAAGGPQTLRLSPDRTGDATEGVTARLLGDFAPTEVPLDLTTRMLFVPSLPANDERVARGPAEWMVLDRSRVTMDGRECDKVGVSYEAFASQGNMCRLQVGACLNSQLEDLRAADVSAVAANRSAQYMATALGDFDLQRFATSNATADTSPYITYVARAPASTLINLVVSADDVQYTLAVAPGVIVRAAMNAETVASSTRDGVLTAEVRNTGAVTARFTLAVTDCSPGIFPMPAQALSLAPQQNATRVFSVLGQDVVYSGAVNCTVVLRDAAEAVADSVLVAWRSEAPDWTNGTQGGDAGPGGAQGATESSKASCRSCGMLNVVCAFSVGCAKQIALQVGLGVALVALIALAVYFRRPLLRLLCCCCKGAGKTSKGAGSGSGGGSGGGKAKRGGGSANEPFGPHPPPPPHMAYYHPQCVPGGGGGNVGNAPYGGPPQGPGHHYYYNNNNNNNNNNGYGYNTEPYYGYQQQQQQQARWG